jgi:hypothetical protein
MVMSTITPPEGVRVFSHRLTRGHPRRLDDDELCCIMSQFRGVEEFVTLGHPASGMSSSIDR